jgi:hypothetical protein
MALQLVEHLFKPIVKPWRQQEALEYSFRMHSSGGVNRFLFLDPMVGFCLRFPDVNIIGANPKCLMGVWENADQFCSFGYRLLQQMSPQQKLDEIVVTFSELQLGQRHSFIHCIDSDKKYLMLRGYIFHYWLEKTSNKKEDDGLHNLVVKSLKANGNVLHSPKKKRKNNGMPEELSPGSHKKQMVLGVHPSIQPLSTDRLAQLVKRRKAIRNRESSGFSSLIGSRSKVPPAAHRNELPVIDK